MSFGQQAGKQSLPGSSGGGGGAGGILAGIGSLFSSGEQGSTTQKVGQAASAAAPFLAGGPAGAAAGLGMKALDSGIGGAGPSESGNIGGGPIDVSDAPLIGDDSSAGAGAGGGSSGVSFPAVAALGIAALSVIAIAQQ